MDEEAIDERMRGLEQYSRRLLNDRLFVKDYEEVRSVVYSFFGLDDISELLVERPAYFTGMVCCKGSISTRIS